MRIPGAGGDAAGKQGHGYRGPPCYAAGGQYKWGCGSGQGSNQGQIQVGLKIIGQRGQSCGGS